jgi:hypothetical protein
MFEICVKEQLTDEHPEILFNNLWKEDIVNIWDEKSEEEKLVYQKLAVIENKEIYLQIQKLDQIIIDYRPGTRINKCFKSGLKVSGKNGIEEDTFFCPIFWYMFETHFEKTKVASDGGLPYDWTSNFPNLLNATIANWQNLNEVECEKFIQIAKKEFANHNGNSDGDVLIDEILTKTLNQHGLFTNSDGYNFKFLIYF